MLYHFRFVSSHISFVHAHIFVSCFVLLFSLFRSIFSFTWFLLKVISQIYCFWPELVNYSRSVILFFCDSQIRSKIRLLFFFCGRNFLCPFLQIFVAYSCVKTRILLVFVLSFLFCTIFMLNCSCHSSKNDKYSFVTASFVSVFCLRWLFNAQSCIKSAEMNRCQRAPLMTSG